VILWAMTYYPRLSDSRRNAIRTEAGVGIEKIRELAAQEERTGENVNFLKFPSAREELKFIEAQIDRATASEQLRHSFAGRFGRLIEPAIRPLGYDWKMGVGLVGAFAAREVFVSTMAITYAAGDEDNTADLGAAMRADTYPNGKPVWTPLVAVSLLIWFVLAMQCMSTLAIVRRETGGWKWPLFMLAYMNALAYVVCLVVYQAGRMCLA
jgi:ferrous iron transport protein B